jgi:hypothetical protein
MAKQAILTLKNWFKTGSRPTQAQFWDLFDSFWHKDEQIPIAKIDGVQPLYDAINNHTTNDDAHATLFNKLKFIPFGKFQIFKHPDNPNGSALEVGDFGAGYINATTFMPFGKYLGGDPMELGSWTTNPLEF